MYLTVCLLKSPKRVIVCEREEQRLQFLHRYYPQVLATTPEKALDYVRQNSDHGGADAVLEVAGGAETFRMAWQCARPNALWQ